MTSWAVITAERRQWLVYVKAQHDVTVHPIEGSTELAGAVDANSDLVVDGSQSCFAVQSNGVVKLGDFRVAGGVVRPRAFNETYRFAEEGRILGISAGPKPRVLVTTRDRLTVERFVKGARTEDVGVSSAVGTILPDGMVVTADGESSPATELGITLTSLTSLDCCDTGRRVLLAATGLDEYRREAYQVVEVGDVERKWGARSDVAGVRCVRLVRGLGDGEVLVALELDNGRIELRNANADALRQEEAYITISPGDSLASVWSQIGFADVRRIRLDFTETAAASTPPEFTLAGHTSAASDSWHGTMGTNPDVSVVRTIKKRIARPWEPARKGAVTVLLFNLLSGTDAEYALGSVSRGLGGRPGGTALHPVDFQARPRIEAAGTTDANGESGLKGELIDAIKEIRPQILYLVAHGEAAQPEPTEQRRAAVGRIGSNGIVTVNVIEPGELIAALRPVGTQMVVVRACKSAQDNRFGWSFAGELHRLGVPVVVGYADEVPAYGSAAHHLAVHEGVLDALTKGESVERALTIAREKAAAVMGAEQSREVMMRNIKGVLQLQIDDPNEAARRILKLLEGSRIRPITYLSQESCGVIGDLRK